MRSKTKAELQEENNELRAYQEAFWALQRREIPRRIQSGEHHVHVLALSRGHGGIVLLGWPDSTSVTWAESILPKWQHGSDPYLQEIGSKIRQLQKEEAERRIS
jgi:hypothetical protein